LTDKVNLEDLRKEIATVTLKILDLCGKRFELARKIAAIKAEKGFPIENLEIENNLKRQVIDFCHANNIDEKFCIGLFELLIKESKRVQREIIRSGSQEESSTRRVKP